MRWLTGLVVVLGCLWSGYWFIGARGFEAGAMGWFAKMEAAGKIARYQALEVQGFPNRFDLTVTAPEIGDAASGIIWQAPFLQILSLSYKPWHVIAAFPPEQRITLPPKAMTVQAGKLQASVVVQPVPALPLDRLVLVGEDLVALGDSGWDLRAASVQFATRQDATRADMHEIRLDVTDLQPDARLVAVMGGVLPDRISLLRMDAVAGFTAPIDRMLLQTRPQVAQLILNDLRVTWGDMSVAAQGSVIADTAGFAEGEVRLRVENWQVALDVAEAMGLIATKDRKLWDQAATFLALGSGGDTAIELPLQFRGGETWIGPLAVGPAPRLQLQLR